MENDVPKIRLQIPRRGKPSLDQYEHPDQLSQRMRYFAELVRDRVDPYTAGQMVEPPAGRQQVEKWLKNRAILAVVAEKRELSELEEETLEGQMKAIRRNRRLVVMEPLARLIYALKRFAPGLMDLAFHLGRRKRIERKLARLATRTPDHEAPGVPRPAIAGQPTAQPRHRAA